MSSPVMFERMSTAHILLLTQALVRLGYTQKQVNTLMQSGRMEKRLKTALEEIMREELQEQKYPALHAATKEPVYTE